MKLIKLILFFFKKIRKKLNFRKIKTINFLEKFNLFQKIKIRFKMNSFYEIYNIMFCFII